MKFIQVKIIFWFLFIKLYWDGLSRKDFLDTVEHDSPSDVVMIKCPFFLYNESNINYQNIPNPKLYTSGLYQIDENYKYIWSTVKKENMKESLLKFDCLFFKEEVGNNTFIEHKVTLNVKWKNKLDVIQSSIKISIDDFSSEKIQEYKEQHKCNVKNEDLRILTTSQDGRLILASLEPLIVGKYFAGQMAYFFSVKGLHEETQYIRVPCFHMLFYDKNKPVIIFTNSEGNKTTFRDDIIFIEFKIPLRTIYLKVGSENTKENIYEGGIITIKKISYTDGKGEIISTESISNSNAILLLDYGIVELSYKYLTKDNYDYVRKIVFIGPKNKNMTLYEPPLSFTHEDRKYLPNCSMDKFEYAYLNMTNIGGKIDYVSNIKERQNSEQILYKDERVIFYDNLNETNFTLNCIYYTPDGIITLKKSFIFVDKKVVAQNYSKDHMYKESHDKKLEYYNEKGFIEAEVNDEIFEEDEHHKHKKTVTFALIMVVFLFIISFNMYLLYHLKIRNKIIKYRKIKMIRQQYSNILTFWSQIKEMELFKEYCKNILNDDYLSSKGKNIRWNTMYAYDDEVVKYDDCTFKDTLVSCYTESETKIVANYVASSKRNYILSDPPNKENIDDFFKMIFIENVRVVVAIIYKNQSESYNKVFLEKMYWPTEKKSFKDIVIEPIKSYDFKESSIFGFEYRMTKDSTVRNFLILHAFNWREYEIPSSKVHFLNLYNEANTYAGDENILLHSSQGGTSRIFLFIYFACIYENMIYGDMISDPMNVIYNVRESRYGGSLDIKEYGFLLNALVTIFFKENYLYDTIDSVTNFDKYYEEFMKEYYYIISLAPKKLVQLVMFLNVINEEKVNELWIQSSRKHIYYDKDLDSKCKRYNNVISKKSGKIIRKTNIPCFDYNGICVKGNPADDPHSFIHANEIVLNEVKEVKRSIILCQTPIKETIDDMLDMIYRNNIGVVVLLLSHQETFESKSTWFPYFPVKDYMLSSDTYYIVKKPLTYKIKDIILVNEYGIVNKENSTKDFKIIHFIKWPDAGFPNNISDINELYECLTKEKQNRNIAIHCGSGIGRTGTFALIMLMINTLETSGVFDPYKSLEVIRRHRFRAVQTLNQFIFAIGVVVEHYKESLGNENSDAIYKFKKLIDKFC